MRAISLLHLTALVALAACSPAERAARRIADKNAEARGGAAAWRAVKTMSMSGKLDAGTPQDPVKLAAAYLRARTENRPGGKRARHDAPPAAAAPIQLPFMMELERPRKTRVEIVFQGETAVQVYDGKAGWKLRPFLGRREVEPYTADELQLAAQQSELDGPLIGAAGKGDKLELVATERVEGRDAYKIKVTSGKAPPRYVWVDTQTNLEVKIDGTRRMDGKPRAVFTTFHDWRTVDGLLIPHLLETTVEGIPGSEKIRVERVAINPQLSGERFARPE